MPLKLLIPIPIITFPVAGKRNLEDGFASFADFEDKVASVFKKVISSDVNISKISPKLHKVTKNAALVRILINMSKIDMLAFILIIMHFFISRFYGS